MHPYTLPLHESLLNYQVLTQIHRWFEFYEHNSKNLNNQIALLTENIHIRSQFEENTGLEAYKARVNKIAPHWLNAHHIQLMELTSLDYKTLSLNLKILYQNIGYLPNEQLTNTPLQYKILMNVDNAHSLPRFAEILIEDWETTVAPEYDTFIPTYAQHRIQSLAYYFSSLLDSKLPNAQNFKDILATEIDLQFPTHHCSNYQEFEHWFAEKPARMTKSKHIIDALTMNTIAPNTYQVTIEFSWTGASQNNPEQPLTTRSLHQWMVIDNPEEPFARIQTMSVQALPCAIVAIA